MRLFKYGAAGLPRSCWGALVSEAGCVRLWFSMSMTKTGLIHPARASGAPEKAAAVHAAAARRPRRARCGRVWDVVTVVLRSRWRVPGRFHPRFDMRAIV